MYTAFQNANSGHRPAVADAEGNIIATCITMSVADMIAEALNGIIETHGAPDPD